MYPATLHEAAANATVRIRKRFATQSGKPLTSPKLSAKAESLSQVPSTIRQTWLLCQVQLRRIRRVSGLRTTQQYHFRHRSSSILQDQETITLHRLLHGNPSTYRAASRCLRETSLVQVPGALSLRQVLKGHYPEVWHLRQP